MRYNKTLLANLGRLVSLIVQQWRFLQRLSDLGKFRVPIDVVEQLNAIVHVVREQVDIALRYNLQAKHTNIQAAKCNKPFVSFAPRTGGNTHKLDRDQPT